MNSKSITGKGAVIAMRLYNTTLTKQGASDQSLILSTEDDPVVGEANDVVRELVMPCYSRSTMHMVIFAVLMGDSQGIVTFDDIEVVVHPQ